MTRIIGIDPGKSGAFAVLDCDEMQVTTHDMPGTIDEKRALISDIGSVKCAWLERPFFPRMIGIKNAVTIAQAYGELKACLFFAGVPVFEVDPSAWKKTMRLSTDKNASRALASQYFPDASDQWARAKDDGRAEATLIALYGWRKN
jgi:crossover junction endodeoxyribonuclease RuvC